MPPLEKVAVASPESSERQIISESNKINVITMAGCPKLSPALNACADRYHDHRERYETVIERANHLFGCINGAVDYAESYTLRACRSTVLNDFSVVLVRTTSIIENFVCERDDEARANVALEWAERYLHHMESTIARGDIGSLDAKLKSLTQALTNRSQFSFDDFSYGVSLATTSDLVFDLGLGPTSFSRGGSSVMSEAKPVAMISAQQLMDKPNIETHLQPYKVEILTSESKRNDFPATSERTGEAHITIKVMPLSGATGPAKVERCTDNCQFGLIKGVRVSQTNACTPRSDMVADLFTSYTEGKSAFTIRLVVNTFRTKEGEIPHFKVQVVLPIA